MPFVGISLLETAAKHRAEVLASVPQLKKAGLCRGEKMCVFNKLCSGTTYSAVSVCSVLKNQHYGTSKKRTREFSELYVRPLQKRQHR